MIVIVPSRNSAFLLLKLVGKKKKIAQMWTVVILKDNSVF